MDFLKKDSQGVQKIYDVKVEVINNDKEEGYERVVEYLSLLIRQAKQ